MVGPRRIAIVVALVAAAGFARWHWDRLTAPQTAPALFDSNVYLEIAARPLDAEQLVYTKPPTVPLVVRAAGRDPATIVAVQRELAFAAWSALVVASVLALRRRVARGVAVVAGLAFVLAAPRVGWSGVVLSESINDSLMAATVACAIGLAIARRRGPRIALTVGLAGLGLAWLFARDSNAIDALAVVIAAALVWPIRRWWAARRAGFALAGLALAGALVMLASARVVPDEPLPFQGYWYPPLTTRAAYPLLDNILGRVLPDDPAWLAARGAPIDVLARYADGGPHTDKLIQSAPADVLRPAQHWLIERGDATYLRWLVRHPIDRIAELVDARWTVLAARHTARMPVGWIAHDHAHLEVEIVRQATTAWWIVLALILGSPVLLWRPRGHPLAALALVLIASGVVAAAASYYGDAVELARHCYGAGQQIVLGLFLALYAWIDRAAWPPWRGAAPAAPTA